MGDLTENIFLNATAADKAEDKELAAFLRYVNDNVVTNAFTKALDKEATRIRNMDDWRLRIMTLEMEMQDRERRIGKREHEKGKAEGLREGEAKGKLESARGTATEMLLADEPVDKIIKYTKLPKEEVEALAAKLAKNRKQ